MALVSGDWQGSRRGFQMMQNGEGMVKIGKILENEILSLVRDFCHTPKVCEIVFYYELNFDELNLFGLGVEL
jgi:hypothetical protein